MNRRHDLLPALLLLLPGAVVAQSSVDPLAMRTKGFATAPVTVYEMSDFQCPFCRRHAIETFPALEREYIATGKVRWIFINFPLTSIHPNAVAAHELAMCAARQGKFWEAHQLERQKKELADKRKREAAEAALAEKRREEQLQRLAALAGDGAPNSTGTAARTAGPSAGYAGRIKARILPHIVFSETITGNPMATVEVKAAPDGTIIGRRLLKSSGVPSWDEAVLRAIDKTEVLPRDTDGRVPSSFEINFRPRE